MLQIKETRAGMLTPASISDVLTNQTIKDFTRLYYANDFNLKGGRYVKINDCDNLLKFAAENGHAVTIQTIN